MNFTPVNAALHAVDIEPIDIQERTFPGEKWLIIYVAPAQLLVAQASAGSIEDLLNEDADSDERYVVAFRATTPEEPARDSANAGRLSDTKIDQLIQLLEARSRTSDALPSLKYVEDPRASLAAVAATRHQLVYGRRGVGKTALLLEAKSKAQASGHATTWVNAHTLRDSTPGVIVMRIADALLSELVELGGTSGSSHFEALRACRQEILDATSSGDEVNGIGSMVSSVNAALRPVLAGDVFRAFVYIDDFYLFDIDSQPRILDGLAGILRDCDGWLKVASIERLTRPYEPSSRRGLEVPHDASKIDLDVTLEDPKGAQDFLESVLTNYTRSIGVDRPSILAKREALGRLVLASGGVPRDYLNLFSASIIAARSRPKAREIGKEDVAVAAGSSARSKKRDLESDVSSAHSGELLRKLETWSGEVKAAGFAYFRVDVASQNTSDYEKLAQLVDLRFAHLVVASISDQHSAGRRFEAYVLDLSEWSDVRLKRGLKVLDLEEGVWIARLTGKAGTTQRLTGTGLRDKLRRAPALTLE